jgi:hypothetical protein
VRAFACFPLLVVGAFLSCTTFSDFDVHQCSSHADCASIAGPILRCEHSLCKQGCASNRHCASIDPSRPLCQYVGGECVGAVSEIPECYLSTGYVDARMGERTLADMVQVGAFAPTLRSSTWLTLQLASDEINAAGGIAVAGELMPVLLTLCDGSQDAVGRAMDHLINRLQVRAVLASLEDAALSIAIQQPSTAGGALLVSPNYAPLDASNPSNARQWIWYLGSRYGDVVAAYPSLLGRVVDAAEGRGRARDVFKIAVILDEAREDQQLSDAVARVVDIDGTGATALTAQDRMHVFRPYTGLPEERSAEFARLANYAPDLVLVFAGGVAETPARQPRALLIRDLESAYAALSVAPFYIFGPRNVEDASLRAFALESASFRGRAAGIRASRPIDMTIGAPMFERFRTAFPEALYDDGGMIASPTIYDAIFYLVYAVAAAPRTGGLLEAVDVRDGLIRVTSSAGEHVVVGSGPDGLERANALQLDRVAISLSGTSGPAEFEPSLQSRPAAVRVYCWNGADDVTDVATYDPVGAELQNVSRGCAQEAFGAL